MLQFGTRVDLCSQVCSGSRDVRGSGRRLCSQVRSGSRDLRGSGCKLCSGCRDVRCSGRKLCSGCRDVRCSGCKLCSGCGDLRCSLCSQVRSGLCSGSGQVLRHRVPDQVLQCRSLRSCTLDL